MIDIDITPLESRRFRVIVREGNDETAHEVTITEEEKRAYARSGEDTEELLKNAFRFLLAREPKESILSEFSLSDIERYFPEFRP